MDIAARFYVISYLITQKEIYFIFYFISIRYLFIKWFFNVLQLKMRQFKLLKEMSNNTKGTRVVRADQI